MLRTKVFFNILAVFALLLNMGLQGVSAAQAADAPAATLRADAIVLVNSASDSYSDFARFTQPYLDHFGIPYTLLDINSQPVPAAIGDYALIVIGHRRIDPDNTRMDSTEQAYLSTAVNAGTGLVNFDNDLSANGVTPRYAFVNTVFSFGYTRRPRRHQRQFAQRVSHYITARHPAGRSHCHRRHDDGRHHPARRLRPPWPPPAASPSWPSRLIRRRAAPSSGAATTGCPIAVKGPMYGLDDLVWRSLVWAARKPFVMQGMPPLVTMRVDDVVRPVRVGTHRQRIRTQALAGTVHQRYRRG